MSGVGGRADEIGGKADIGTHAAWLAELDKSAITPERPRKRAGRRPRRASPDRGQGARQRPIGARPVVTIPAWWALRHPGQGEAATCYTARQVGGHFILLEHNHIDPAVGWLAHVLWGGNGGLKLNLASDADPGGIYAAGDQRLAHRVGPAERQFHVVLVRFHPAGVTGHREVRGADLSGGHHRGVDDCLAGRRELVAVEGEYSRKRLSALAGGGVVSAFGTGLGAIAALSL